MRFFFFFFLLRPLEASIARRMCSGRMFRIIFVAMYMNDHKSSLNQVFSGTRTFSSTISL
jgi:hypothetical protein